MAGRWRVSARALPEGGWALLYLAPDLRTCEAPSGCSSAAEVLELAAREEARLDAGGAEPAGLRRPTRARPWRVKARAPRDNGKDGRHWQLVIRGPDGRTRQRTTGTEDPAEAVAMAIAEERRLNAGGPPPALTVVEVLELYLADCSRTGRLRPRSLEAARGARGRLKGLALSPPTRAKVLAAQDALLAEGLAPVTVKNILGRARVAWTWAWERELVPHAWPQVKGLRCPPTTKRPCTEDEAIAILEQIKAYNGGWAFPVVLTLWDTGARVSEVLSLREEDVDREAGSLTFRAETVKTGRARTVPVSAEVLALIPRRGPGQRVFETATGKAPVNRNSVYLAFRAAKKAAGLEGAPIDLHSLRRTFATDSLRSGLPVPLVMKLMGHSSPAMTLHYQTLALGDDLEDAAAKVREHRARRRATEGEGRVLRFPRERREGGAEEQTA